MYVPSFGAMVLIYYDWYVFVVVAVVAVVVVVVAVVAAVCSCCSCCSCPGCGCFLLEEKKTKHRKSPLQFTFVFVEHSMVLGTATWHILQFI